VFKEKLLEIPDEQFRSILNLRYLQDLPPVEIAHELKLPSSKFDKEFRHAFQELMKKLNRRDLTAQDFALMGH
jgi:DNA-directed RNA polymerase specialized sigma24 family protein